MAARAGRTHDTAQRSIEKVQVARLAGFVRPGGRLIIQDLRRDAGVFDLLRSSTALARALCLRLIQTGWPVSSRLSLFRS